MIAAHLALRVGGVASPTAQRLPLFLTLALGGTPLLYDLLHQLFRRESGSDLLGGIGGAGARRFGAGRHTASPTMRSASRAVVPLSDGLSPGARGASS
jgi:hypothetical protein